MKAKKYPEYYLCRTLPNIADLFDYAINVCKLDKDTFLRAFVKSQVAKGIEQADITTMVGKTGPEYLLEIAKEQLHIDLKIEIEPRYKRSIEYWIGYVLCYYQYHSGLNFATILKKVPYQSFYNMYRAYHQCDIEKFVEDLDDIIKGTSKN